MAWLNDEIICCQCDTYDILIDIEQKVYINEYFCISKDWEKYAKILTTWFHLDSGVKSYLPPKICFLHIFYLEI